MAPDAFKFSRSFLAFVFLGTVGLATATNAEAKPPQLQAANNDITVKLLDAGASPRKEIRFTPAKGTQQTSIMTMDMQIEVSVAGQKPPQQKMPSQRMTIEIVVDDVSDNGDISYRFEYTDIEVIDDPNNPSPAAKAIQDAVTPMIGMTGSGVTSSRGFARSAQINVPDDAPAMVKQLLDGMKDAMKRLSAPLPAEPVGIGAKWEVVQNLTMNGMTLTQTSVHVLTAMEEQGFTMSSEIKQSADPQEVKNPALPPTIKMMLDSLNTNGQGVSQLHTDSVMPVTSKVTVDSDANMTMMVAGQQQKMQTSTVLEMTLEAP